MIDMKVIVRGKNKFEPTDAIRGYAEDKVQKLSNYFNDSEEITATVLCKVYDAYQQVEITVPTKHIILRAEVKGETVYAAIDLAIDKLETQIRRHKSKLYKSIKQREGLSNHYASQSEFDLKELETEIMVTNLVKNKQVELKPLSKEDAILQMEMLGHDFFVFQNEDSKKVCVVYVREDGDYGIIETNI